MSNGLEFFCHGSWKGGGWRSMCFIQMWSSKGRNQAPRQEVAKCNKDYNTPSRRGEQVPCNKSISKKTHQQVLSLGESRRCG
jgi:hypothetical protein